MSTTKFTKGEKCIFAHIVITFLLIITLIIIYIVHLCIVSHNGNDIYRISRRAAYGKDAGQSSYRQVGLVYLNTSQTKMLCNSFLLRHQWSVAPAHCVAIRSDPEMAQLIFMWKVKYKTNQQYLESNIKSSVVHPHFNRDDFSNNIGLLEHTSAIAIFYYIFPNTIKWDEITFRNNDMNIVSWKMSPLHHEESDNIGEVSSLYVKAISASKCAHLLSPVVTLRDYEICVMYDKGTNDYAEYGAMFVINKKIIGFFSWGDTYGKDLPLVVLNVLDYKSWILNVISFL